MSKYEPLAERLRRSDLESIGMTFGEIEGIIGESLPPSAFKHRAWWSNNPSNSVITHAWLNAGYKTANVDMSNRTLEFRRTQMSGDRSNVNLNQNCRPDADSGEAAGDTSFLSVFGALEGSVTIAPGTDLTAPLGQDWNALR